MAPAARGGRGGRRDGKLWDWRARPRLPFCFPRRPPACAGAGAHLRPSRPLGPARRAPRGPPAAPSPAPAKRGTLSRGPGPYPHLRIRWAPRGNIAGGAPEEGGVEGPSSCHEACPVSMRLCAGGGSCVTQAVSVRCEADADETAPHAHAHAHAHDTRACDRRRALGRRGAADVVTEEEGGRRRPRSPPAPDAASRPARSGARGRSA